MKGTRLPMLPICLDRKRRAMPILALTLLAFSIVVAAVAQAASADVITDSIDNAKRVAVPDQRVRWAKAESDRGAVPADLALDHLSLVLRRTPERQQAWERLLQEQQDPTSANYHHWLSPLEVGERFGASQHDIDALSEWLRTQGLRVESVSNSRMRIVFSGRAADVAAAFATKLNYFQVGTEKRIANSASPTIPAALSDTVLSVIGLNSVRFKPTHSASATRPASLPPGAPQPLATVCGDGGDCQHVVFPADFARIYDIDAPSLQGIDGRGQTIAIVGRSRVYEPDMLNFQARAGLPTKYPVVIVPPTGTDPGDPASACSDAVGSTLPSCTNPDDKISDQSEATLDVQRAGSVAPGATIDLIVADNVGTADGLQIALEYAVDTHPLPAHILSISYLTCEPDNGSAVVRSIDAMFAQAAAEGISIFVASGDSGAAACADHTGAPPATQTLGINALCSSGYVTCVGGTQFADSAQPSTYWAPTSGANYLSALGYIPEGAWNEPLDRNSAPQLGATGGGISIYIAKPAWQTGIGVPANASRNTPDVSLTASVHDGYFTCMAAQSGSCVVANHSFNFLISAGTSASAPSMAGITALLNQKVGAPQSNLNPRLYALAANPGNGVFHDVTIASSGVTACSLATPSLCNNSTPGPGGLSGGLQGYTVGDGYDLATGLGSVDVANLLAQWNSPTAGAVNLDQHGLTGAWYDPSTAGQGLVIEVGKDSVAPGVGGFFAGWFTYDATAAGGQRWYSIQGQVSATAASASMPIYLTQGGTFDAHQVPVTNPVGTATITFGDCTHGTLGYSFTDGSGRSGSIPLTRLTSNVSCGQSGDTGVVTTGGALAGTWYEPDTSGQGFVLDVNPAQSVLFAAWYTYAPNALPSAGPSSQRWYTLQATLGQNAGSVSDIGIYATTGGTFNHPGGTTTTQVGTATLVFHTCTSATLMYQFHGGASNGLAGSTELTRLLPAPAVCNL